MHTFKLFDLFLIHFHMLKSVFKLFLCSFFLEFVGPIVCLIVQGYQNKLNKIRFVPKIANILDFVPKISVLFPVKNYQKCQFILEQSQKCTTFFGTKIFCQFILEQSQKMSDFFWNKPNFVRLILYPPVSSYLFGRVTRLCSPLDTVRLLTR